MEVEDVIGRAGQQRGSLRPRVIIVVSDKTGVLLRLPSRLLFHR
jgi:hypothetical protein